MSFSDCFLVKVIFNNPLLILQEISYRVISPKTEIVPQKQGEPKENWSSLKKTLFFIKGKRLVELFKNFVNHTKSNPVDSSRLS